MGGRTTLQEESGIDSQDLSNRSDLLSPAGGFLSEVLQSVGVAGPSLGF